MTITLDEIQERKEHLRQEIMERECLLAALEILHKHMAGNRGSRSIDAGAFLPVLLASPAGQVALLESPPAALPPPPPPAPYMHPELAEFGYNRHGSTTEIVRWAIARLTGDYTLRDIHALLKKEGRPLRGAEISVVISRLKNRREITEIQCGYGRKPAIFRKPALASNEPTEALA